jgi:hypothetical protein
MGFPSAIYAQCQVYTPQPRAGTLQFNVGVGPIEIVDAGKVLEGCIEGQAGSSQVHHPTRTHPDAFWSGKNNRSLVNNGRRRADVVQTLEFLV